MVNSSVNKRVATISQVRQIVNSKLTDNVETKRLGISCSGNLGTSGTMFPLTQGIIVGDTSFERSGEAITITEVDVRGMPIINGSATSRTSYLRMVIFQDTMNNGNTPSVGHLIATTDVTANWTDDVWKTKRMRILYDYTFNTGTINSGFNSKPTHTTIRMNRKVFYQGSTDATASNGAGSLWLYAWSTDATNSPAIQANILVKYRDA